MITFSQLSIQYILISLIITEKNLNVQMGNVSTEQQFAMDLLIVQTVQTKHKVCVLNSFIRTTEINKYFFRVLTCIYLIDVRFIRSVVNMARVWIKITNVMVKETVLMAPMKLYPNAKLYLYKPLYQHASKRLLHDIRKNFNLNYVYFKICMLIYLFILCYIMIN